MIYFIQEPICKLIKIGYTKSRESLLRRFHGNACWFPNGMNMLKFVEGDAGTEKALHLEFAHLWHKGEWFNEGPDLLAKIDSMPSVEKTIGNSKFDNPLTKEHIEHFIAVTSRDRTEKGSIYLRTMMYGRYQPGEFLDLHVGELMDRVDRGLFPPDLTEDLKTFYATKESTALACDVKYHRLRQFWDWYRPMKVPLSALLNWQSRYE